MSSEYKKKRRFCDKCGDFLTLKKIKDKKVVLYCLNCKEEYDIESNILIYKVGVKQNQKIKTNVLTAMLYDKITYPKIKKKIPSHKDCDNEILVYARDVNTMKNVYVCQKCKKSWIL
jgi:DNA-directed RNA polymerase subunit M/transcription elongation factor TFIIS